MTKQLCKDCKHLETDGMFGIFCGVGGNNTKYDCPKYEKRTSKRFTLTNPKNNFQEMKCGIDDRGNTLTFNEVVDLLNALNDKNEQLKERIGMAKLRYQWSEYQDRYYKPCWGHYELKRGKMNMTAKRFTINNDMSFNDKIETYELNCINDNENKTFYFIADSIQNVQLFIKQLNKLHEENKRLKEKIQRERKSFIKTQERWSKEAENKIKELSEENEQLQKSLSGYVEKNRKLQTILDKLGYTYVGDLK